MKKEWTSISFEHLLSRITFDFVTQLEKKMELMPSFRQSDLAKKLQVTEADVSQVLNNRPNLGLKTILKYAQGLGLKVAIVAYEDEREGAVNSEIFTTCWERSGRPADFFELDDKPQMDDFYYEKDATNVVFLDVGRTQAGIMAGGYTKTKLKA